MGLHIHKSTDPDTDAVFKVYEIDSDGEMQVEILSSDGNLSYTWLSWEQARQLARAIKRELKATI